MPKRGHSGHLLVFLTLLGLAMVGLLWLAGQDPHLTASARTAAAPDAIVATFRARAQTDTLAAVNRQEDAVLQITDAVLQPWEQSWTRQDATAFRALLSASAQLPDLTTPLAAPWRSHSGIDERRWSQSRETVRGADRCASMLASYLSQFARVEWVAVEAHAVDMQAEQTRLLLHIDVRGTDKNGQRRQDRGFAEGVFTRQDSWKLAELTLRSMDTLTSSKPAFEDRTSQSKLDSVPTYQRVEAIRRGGYAIAMGDYDGDGKVDMYVGAWGPGQLFRNTGDGRFQDVTQSSGLGSDTLVKAAAFVDLHNHGRKDLVLSRFVADAAGEEVVVYENTGGGHFTRVPNAVARTEQYDRAMPMSIADFNHDGRLDLYVGFPGARDFTVLNFDEQHLSPQGIFLNDGNGRFVDATRHSRINERLATLNSSTAGRGSIFPHASVAADWDGKGQTDLLVVDDRRNTNAVFEARADGSFQEVGAKLGIQNNGWGMGVAVGDYNGDGLQDVYLTNVDFLAAKRMAKAMSIDQSLFNGNHLFQNLGNGRFQDVTEKAGVGWAGQAAGGATWLDYDNDGNLDLYVVNGLWSGPGRQDLSSLFVRDYLAERERPQTVASHGVSDVSMMSLRGDESGHLVMRALTGYRGDLAHPDQAAHASQATLSMGGYQRNCLFRNNGDGTFTEIGYLAGVDCPEDGYVAATADLSQDGHQDLILRNADPGTMEKTFPCVKLLTNVARTGNHYLTVALQGDGQKSNRDAVGATVWLWAGGKKQSRQLQTLSGASQNEMALHFGLGSAKQVDRLVVRWPSGRTQTLRSLAVDRRLQLRE